MAFSGVQLNVCFLEKGFNTNILLLRCGFWRGYGAPYTQRGDDARRTAR